MEQLRLLLPCQLILCEVACDHGGTLECCATGKNMSVLNAMTEHFRYKWERAFSETVVHFVSRSTLRLVATTRLPGLSRSRGSSCEMSLARHTSSKITSTFVVRKPRSWRPSMRFLAGPPLKRSCNSKFWMSRSRLWSAASSFAGDPTETIAECPSK